LLLPPYCRFLLWLSIQDDVFYDEANGLGPKGGVDNGEKRKLPSIVKKDSLWQTLIADLALTYEQDEKLKSLYKYVYSILFDRLDIISHIAVSVSV
jgi:hypothetical protein